MPTGGARADQPALERRWADSVIPEMEVPPRASTAGERSSQPEAPVVPLSGGELVVGRVVTTRVPVRQRSARVVSAPRPMEVGPRARWRPTRRPPVLPRQIGH